MADLAQMAKAEYDNLTRTLADKEREVADLKRKYTLLESFEKKLVYSKKRPENWRKSRALFAPCQQKRLKRVLHTFLSLFLSLTGQF